MVFLILIRVVAGGGAAKTAKEGFLQETGIVF
jgi:hypothetical protein